jgi:hypothetical protein
MGAGRNRAVRQVTVGSPEPRLGCVGCGVMPGRPGKIQPKHGLSSHPALGPFLLGQVSQATMKQFPVPTKPFSLPRDTSLKRIAHI